MVMPNIYDIAEKRQGNRMNPIEAAMEGQQWRSEQKARDLNVEVAAENLDVAKKTNDEFDANAGSRKQAQMIADNVTKHAEVGRILSSGLSKETYEANAKTLQQLMPEAEFPDSWEEAQDELAQWQPYFDEQYGAQKKIESYRERAQQGDKTAAAIIAGLEAEQADKLQTAALKAAKLEQEIATGRANEVKGYAQAGKADAEAQAALMNPGGVGSNGGRGTQKERASAIEVELLDSFESGQPLTSAQKARGAAAFNLLYPPKPVMIPGTQTYRLIRAIPEHSQNLAKAIFGSSYQPSEDLGEGKESSKTREERKANERATKLINAQVDKLQKTIAPLDESFFGLRGYATGVKESIEEQATGKTNKYNKVKQQIVSGLRELEGYAKTLKGEAKNSSDKDMAAIRELLGENMWATKTSMTEALTLFKAMTKRINDSYKRQGSEGVTATGEKRTIKADELEAWLSQGSVEK